MPSFRTIASILFSIGLTHAAAGGELQSPVAKIELQDNDTLVFLGDSITHQCLYTQYVEDYFYTRYPSTRIHFHNAGVGGDKAQDALIRFDQDVASFKPKYITVLLGMNDGRYQHFNHDVFGTYEKDMTALLGRIAETGATTVLMSPTMFDAGAAKLKNSGWLKDRPDAIAYYNGVLAFYGAWLREQATDRGLGFVDLYSPLNRITFEQRKSDPSFTLVADSVHPGANGQVVMAYAILEQMHANRNVSALSAHRAGKGWRVRAGDTGKVTQVEGDDRSLHFTFHADALPWVLPAEAKLGYALTKAGHKLSNERLVVRGLKPGRYQVKIDGVLIGTYATTKLATRVELQSNPRTPQYQQALKVAALNAERNEKAIRPLRNLWRDMKVRRMKKDSEAEAYKEFTATFDARVAEVHRLAEEYEDKIYAANQTAPRRYEISRVETESLFNGKKLDGWVIENDGRFSVRDGRLFVDKGTGWLRSAREYGDFVLEMDFRFLEKEANSGIFVRTGPTSKNDDKGWPDNGYQIQCMDTLTGDYPLGTMIPYGAPPFVHESDLDALADAYRPTKQWNHYEITCVGERLTVKLNGRTITTAHDIKNLRGHVGIQAELGLLEFRNIRISVLD